MKLMRRNMARIYWAVRAIKEYDANRDGPMADAILVRLGFSEKEAAFALELASMYDYIDYGVSARTGWVTEKGDALYDGALLDIVHDVEPPKVPA